MSNHKTSAAEWDRVGRLFLRVGTKYRLIGQVWLLCDAEPDWTARLAQLREEYDPLDEYSYEPADSLAMEKESHERILRDPNRGKWAAVAGGSATMGRKIGWYATEAEAKAAVELAYGVEVKP